MTALSADRQTPRKEAGYKSMLMGTDVIYKGGLVTRNTDGDIVAEDLQDTLNGSANGLYIGVGKDYAAGTYFGGMIDDVRIYNRVVRP